MKCMYCEGQMKKDVTPHHIDRQGYHLTLDSIPAWICEQCGEVFFEGTEVKAIQEVIRSLDEGTQKILLAA